MQLMGSAEGRSPIAGGTGVPPVFGFITPFLARKGDGGKVERAEEHRPRRGGAGGLRQRPPSARMRVTIEFGVWDQL